jgi:hypothetical protein
LLNPACLALSLKAQLAIQQYPPIPSAFLSQPISLKNPPICLNRNFRPITAVENHDQCTYNYMPDLEISKTGSPDSVQISIRTIQNSFIVHQKCNANKYCYSCCADKECQTDLTCDWLFALRQNEANIYVLLYTLCLLFATLV